MQPQRPDPKFAPFPLLRYSYQKQDLSVISIWGIEKGEKAEKVKRDFRQKPFAECVYSDCFYMESKFCFLLGV